MKGRTKQALVARALGAAVLGHELAGHGDPHVELQEHGAPFLIVSQVVITSTGGTITASATATGVGLVSATATVIA